MKKKLRTWLAGVGSAFPSAFSPYWRVLPLGRMKMFLVGYFFVGAAGGFAFDLLQLNCPYRKFVQPMGDVIAPTGPQATRSLRLSLRQANEFAMHAAAREQNSNTFPMAQGEKARRVVESGFFRQPVVRSDDAVH